LLVDLSSSLKVLLLKVDGKYLDGDFFDILYSQAEIDWLVDLVGVGIVVSESQLFLLFHGVDLFNREHFINVENIFLLAFG